MSGTRFARSGRCRFFVCLGVFVIMVLFVAIFHSSQLQLDESRAERLRCEQTQEGLNEQLQTILEQKFNLEKTHEHERKSQIESQRIIEQKLKETIEQREKELLQARVRYEKVEQTFKLLQLKHDELEDEYAKSKKDQVDETNAFEKRLQALRMELQQDKSVQVGEMSIWKEKYNKLLHEKEMNTHANAAHIANLKSKIADYKQNCDFKPKASDNLQQQQLNKPPKASQTTRNSHKKALSFDKPRNDKSFNEQVQVSTGYYRIGVNLANNNKTTEENSNNINNNNNSTNIAAIINRHALGFGYVSTAAEAAVSLSNIHQPLLRHNHSLILNSVENFQMVPKSVNIQPSEEIEAQLKQQEQEAVGAAPMAGAALVADKMVSPLSSPRKSSPASTSDGTKNAQGLGHLNQALNATAASSSTRTSSSSNMPPLAMPPPKSPLPSERKLPENVAPIPDNFEDLQQPNKVDPADVDTAAEDLRKNDNEEGGGKNNRYANVVDDMETGKEQQQQQQQQQKAINEDSGAHEVKDHDHDFLNEQNFNLPVDEDNHFFDNGAAVGAVGDGGDKHAVDDKLVAGNNNNDDDDDDLMANDAADGDVAVKPAQHLLDADNLNNEIAGDQGKEFADGLRLDDVNEEDQDEDDYSNMAARKQGAEAIRN